MHIIHSVEEFLAWRRNLDPHTTIGFTPTMGALHDGHLAHIDALQGTVDLLVASVFVNPTQFGKGEDLDKYPRDLEGDAMKLKEAGCNLLFYPHEREIYPDGFNTWVNVQGVADGYEAAFRPEHFRGVATVVCKLLNIVRPNVMTLGQKDAQQVAVVKKMIRDLNIDTHVRVIETLREKDGLAMSSRNVYLSPEERREGTTIYRALLAGKHALESDIPLHDVVATMRKHLSEHFQVDYFDLVDAATFVPPENREKEMLGVFAGRIGGTRLIDNMVLKEGG